MTSLRRILSIAQTAFVSKKTDRKIVVFESDDWGSIRTPRNVGSSFDSHINGFDKNPYHRYDTLESPTDLDALINTLEKIRIGVGKRVCLSYNNVAANPDFDKIKSSNYETYYYEPFPETYNRYFGTAKGVELVKQAEAHGIFSPQFHGREHVHVPFWLDQLKDGDPVFLKAFEWGFWGVGLDVYSVPTRNVQASFNIRNKKDLSIAKDALIDGLKLHKKVFGSPSKSFIPNNYIWPEELNTTLVEQGVDYLQGMKKQVYPALDNEQRKSLKLRKAGHKTVGGLINLVRNSGFEPSFYKDREKEVKKCLSEIKTAFLFRQPAVISTHRINFIGGLEEKNRTLNLRLFTELIKAIVKTWPEVEFWSSEQLGKYYKQG